MASSGAKGLKNHIVMGSQLKPVEEENPIVASSKDELKAYVLSKDYCSRRTQHSRLEEIFWGADFKIKLQTFPVLKEG